MPNQVDPEVNKYRSNQLHNIARVMRKNFLNQHINRTYSVLWEAPHSENSWAGYTENFIRVELKYFYHCNLENKISRVNIIGIESDANHCIAEII